MAQHAYQYALDFFREDGSALAQVPVTPDWAPALEWAHFDGVRHAQLPAVIPADLSARAVIEPVWHAQSGEPFVRAVRVTIAAHHGGVVMREIPSTYFAGLAQSTAVQLVEKKALQRGEVFRYLLTARAGEPQALAEPEPGGFSVEEIEQPLPLDEQSLEEFFRGSIPSGTETVGEDMPVFIPRHVLDEATALARKAGDFETGGVLVGKLHRDRSVPEIFVEITALIPAAHTEAGATKLTFTAETWAAVRTAIALRKRGEAMTTWFHSHVDFCRLRNCPVERRKDCDAARPFLSAEDLHLHAACFGRAFHTALLISESTADGYTASLFGWRHGLVVPRAFHIIEDPSALLIKEGVRGR
jgi:proteasome lid subunit RPN8/RPN11